VADAASAAGAQPTLLLTGGAAAELRPHLHAPADHVPDLVLRGLAALTESGVI
jgi:pantothenate kinase type III